MIFGEPLQRVPMLSLTQIGGRLLLSRETLAAPEQLPAVAA